MKKIAPSILSSDFGNLAREIRAVEEAVDMVVIMSVNPGFGGQELIRSALAKIKRVRKLLDEAGSKAELEVDGGIKAENIRDVSLAGADVFVSGSGIFKTKDYKKTIAEMRKRIG